MDLNQIAEYIVSDGKGILAADESNPTCGKRFDTINVENTEDNRRDYREMLFRSKGMKDNIGGVILFDETLRQNAIDGTPLRKIIEDQGALPGIKVDKGLIPLKEGSDEVVTQGLDGLHERCADYDALFNAKFTKWRAVIKIGDGIPTDECIEANAKALADYAWLAQTNNMVPIVEPEVLMDGDHTITECFDACARSFSALFNALQKKEVDNSGLLLKPSMVTPGSLCSQKATIQEVADLTIKCLKENVPSDVPGITFLSGGQSELEATAHLNAMNKEKDLPWKLSFSYGRALQQSALRAWGGLQENLFIAQDELSHRANMNKLAALGEWSEELEER